MLLEIAKPIDHRPILLRRTNRNPQELRNPLLLEVPHDHALLTQLGRQTCRIMLRVTGEDEVGRRRQHFEAFLLQLGDDLFATVDDSLASALEVLTIFKSRRRADDRQGVVVGPTAGSGLLAGASWLSGIAEAAATPTAPSWMDCRRERRGAWWVVGSDMLLPPGCLGKTTRRGLVWRPGRVRHVCPGKRRLQQQCASTPRAFFYMCDPLSTVFA